MFYKACVCVGLRIFLGYVDLSPIVVGWNVVAVVSVVIVVDRMIVVGLRIVLLEIGNMLHLWERVVQSSNNFSEDCNFKQFVFSFQRSIELRGFQQPSTASSSASHPKQKVHLKPKEKFLEESIRPM